MTGRVVSHFATFHQGCQGMCYKTLWTEMKLWSVCLPGVHKTLGFAPGTAEGQETSQWTSGSSEARSLPHHFSASAFVFDPSGYFLQKKGCSCEKTFWVCLQTLGFTPAFLLLIHDVLRLENMNRKWVRQTEPLAHLPRIKGERKPKLIPKGTDFPTWGDKELTKKRNQFFSFKSHLWYRSDVSLEGRSDRFLCLCTVYCT